MNHVKAYPADPSSPRCRAGGKVVMVRTAQHCWLVLPLILGGSLGCKPRPPQATVPAPPPAKVTAARPIPHEVTDYQEYTGYLEAVEMVSIRARVRGFLQKVAFKEGSIVKKGDLLYEIDPREYEAALDKAKADQAKSAAELRKAQSEEDRAARLRRQNAISEEEYTQRVVAKETALATVNQAGAAVKMAELDLSFTRIVAPTTGQISRTMVNEGNLVGYNEATVLTNIVSLDPIYLVFDVPEHFAVRYQQQSRRFGSPGADEQQRIPVDLAVANETGFPHHGYIDFRENRVDIGTGTIRLRAVAPNSDRSLYPGLYTRVRVPEGPPEQRLMIPEAALMADQRGRFVYVIKPDRTIEARTVTVGTKLGTLVAINTGLRAEDLVVINGLQRARPGAKVDPQIVPLTPPGKDDTRATATPTVIGGTGDGNSKSASAPGK